MDPPPFMLFTLTMIDVEYQLWRSGIPYCGHNEESPPSFCNGLGTIYIASSRGKTFFDLTTRDMGLELRYSLRKVLSIQNCSTLRLASSHCVLCFNPIKGTLNIVILTHTHTSIHLTINMASNIPNHTSIILIITPKP